ncbi:SGNH/GDSL hydrolase family protein [Maribacter sp. 2307UL18-2]|uniref:SGNH/GDSL hydrolase family protein n=1 Tax=Maribacter sp. 2307UL18-2 TaxID=3386274 RepID=UPI0039BD23FC
MKKFKIFMFATLLSTFAANYGFAQDWPNLAEFQEANAALEAPKQGEDRVVFMGNSITIGWINSRPEFFEGKPWVNRGISGQTTPQMLVRFRQDVIDLHPKVVVLLAGTNDIAGNTGPSTIPMIMDNIKGMAEMAHANGIKVILSSTLPAYDYPWRTGLEPAPKIIELNKMIKTYCEEKGHTYLDYFSAMVDDRNGLPKKYAEDEVHPTVAGYKVMEPLVEAAIAKSLNK